MSDEPPPFAATDGPLGVTIADPEVHPAGRAGASNRWWEPTFPKLTADEAFLRAHLVDS